MIVYVVEHFTLGQGSIVIGAFGSLEKAKEFAESYKRNTFQWIEGIDSVEIIGWQGGAIMY